MTRTTVLRNGGAIKLLRKALLDASGNEVHVAYVLQGPGPKESVFENESEAIAAFEDLIASNQPSNPTP